MKEDDSDIGTTRTLIASYRMIGWNELCQFCHNSNRFQGMLITQVKPDMAVFTECQLGTCRQGNDIIRMTQTQELL